MLHKSPVEYYLLNETLVDEETNRKHWKIIDENIVDLPNGLKLFTLTYNVVLTEFARRNWNGRTYARDVFMNSLNGNPLLQHDLKNNGGLASEYGHPQIEKGQNEIVRQMTLDPKLVCAMLHRYWEENTNLLLGTYTTVAGGYGDVLRDRILTGVPAMVSSRSVGGVDSRGNVLPGFTLITWDHVFRPSSQDARQVRGSEKVNNFSVPAGRTMSESAVLIDTASDDFRNFLLTESVSRDKIQRVCDTMGLNYDSMTIVENSVRLERVDGLTKSTLVMPLNKLVGTELHNIF